MIIRLEDIPVEGRKLSFPVDSASINERLSGDGRLESTTYRCPGIPQAEVELQANGKTVIIEGRAQGEFVGSCARCAEDATVAVDRGISMVLKPRAPEGREEIEDVQLGYYDGKEIDLGPIVEEQLILSLPYAFVCRNDCKGLCPRCGANLNSGLCGCRPEPEEGSGFQVLKGLRSTEVTSLNQSASIFCARQIMFVMALRGRFLGDSPRLPLGECPRKDCAEKLKSIGFSPIAT